MPTNAPAPAAAENMRAVARLDIPGGGQVVVRDGYAYVGHMRPPNGTSIIDVRDPANPKVVGHVPPPSPYSHTHKVRFAGDLMIANVEQDRRHFIRKGENIPAAEAKLAAELGRPPSEAEIAKAIGVKDSDMEDLRAAVARGYSEGGFRLFDASDPANPRELCHVKTGGVGVHRFDADERYAYISTEMDGYLGNILVIYDLKDPTRPEEVSRWWMPGQHVAGGETPHWDGRKNRLHHALRFGDRLWAACWYAGGWVIDISDISKPKTLGSFDYHPPIPEPTHTFMPVPQKIGGRDLALMIDEEHDGHVRGQPHGFLWVVDVTDVTDIKPVSTFQVSELDSPFARVGSRFGAHQFQEHLSGTHVFCTWFAGGLRVVDIADPSVPREVGFFVPQPASGHAAPQSNDVDVDDRGLAYVIDREVGFDIVEFTG